MDWLRPDLWLPILGALAAGALVGFERDFRGRSAGLRTHALICVASALLMQAAVHQLEWMPHAGSDVIRIDPVRMAHGVLTGIGFLCGGVIFRQGFSVHGLTTAASMWITSALGMLFGVGFWPMALGGTAITLLILSGFRFVEAALPNESIVDAAIRTRREAAMTPQEFEALVASLGLRAKFIGYRLEEGGTVAERSAVLSSSRAFPLDELNARLTADPRVVGFDLTPRND